MEFKHKQVMLEECIQGLNIKENGIYIDGTLGGAGHSKEIAKRLSKEGLLIGIDRDEEALKAAKEKLKEFPNVKYIHNNHDNIKEIIEELNIEKVDGILLRFPAHLFVFRGRPRRTAASSSRCLSLFPPSFTAAHNSSKSLRSFLSRRIGGKEPSVRPSIGRTDTRERRRDFQSRLLPPISSQA